MKKIILSLLTITLTLSICIAQDAITKKSGEDIQAKILEINQSEIKYKKFDNLDGPIFSLLKSDILLIRYSNGTKEIFNEEKKTDVALAHSDELTKEGQDDAKKHYDGYKGAGTGTLVTGLVVGPVLGLIPAIACSSTSPSDENLNYPSAEKMKKPDYYNGYTQQSYKIKKKKVWKNFWIALAVDVAAVFVIGSAM